MKKKISEVSLYSILIFLMLQLLSCGETNDPNPPSNDDEEISIEKAESLQMRTGNNRVELSWHVSDLQVSSYKIFYNNRLDSVGNRIHKKHETDTIRVIIDELPEDYHSFDVFNYDDHGNSSPRSIIAGRVYGSDYQTSLLDATFSYHSMDGDDLKIKWGEKQPTGLVGVEIEYTHLDGNLVKKQVTDWSDTCVLESYSKYAPLGYRSLYLPEATAIDTFSTAVQEHILYKEIDAETFAKLILENTNLVNSIQKNVSTTITSGLTYTEIEYLNKDNAPMALYILLADIENNVSLKATAAANGDNLNSKESVRRQVGYVKDRGYDVLAAVNGDFWRVNANETDNTPMRQTYGALYIDGVMKKDITRTASQYYYSAILDNGMFTTGDKNHYNNNKTEIRESIGGRYLLVENGEYVGHKISNTAIAPRTSVGKFDSHWVVFIVVDGRRPTHSQGVTMQELGMIYNAIGVKTAINLDGGGSTTLFVKDSNNELELKNKPSDNAERSVANAWTIVKTR